VEPGAETPADLGDLGQRSISPVLVVPAVAMTTAGWSSPRSASASAAGIILSAAHSTRMGAGMPSSQAARATL
jgi:hypothetical protein